MTKFVFQLDGVLRHREHIEREKQRDVSIHQTAMARLQDELRDLDAAVQNNVQDLKNNHLTGRLDMTFLAAHRRYALAMQRKAMGVAQAMAAEQRKLEAAQKALLEASKQRKTMEKLRDRQRERWAMDLARREAAEMDEIGMQLSAPGLRAEEPA